MAKTPAAPDSKRPRGSETAEQPYSVDPKKTPNVGKGAAGPKRWQTQPGQALEEPEQQKDGADGE